MHQDTRDALDLLIDALDQQPDSDAREALAVFDRHPAVERQRRIIAREAAQAARPRRGLNKPNADGHQVGDVVAFNNGTSKYLAGLTVKVSGTNTYSVIVDVPNDPRYRKWAGLTGIRCSNGIIQAAA